MVLGPRASCGLWASTWVHLVLHLGMSAFTANGLGRCDVNKGDADSSWVLVA